MAITVVLSRFGNSNAGVDDREVYANARIIQTTADGHLQVVGPTETGSATVLGLYPPGRWLAAYHNTEASYGDA